MGTKSPDQTVSSLNSTPSDDSVSRRSPNRSRHIVNNQITVARFNGRCEELNGNIYDRTDIRQADQYTKTTKYIAANIGQTYKYGTDIRLAVEILGYVPINIWMIRTKIPQRLNSISGKKG